MSRTPSRSDVAFATLMSFVTTFIVTFCVAWVNIGFSSKFLLVWMRSWLVAFVLVALAILFLAPQIKALLSKRKD